MVKRGSEPVFKHRLRMESCLNASSEGQFMAISSIHQFSTPTRCYHSVRTINSGQADSLRLRANAKICHVEFRGKRTDDI